MIAATIAKPAKPDFLQSEALCPHCLSGKIRARVCGELAYVAQGADAVLEIPVELFCDNDPCPTCGNVPCRWNPIVKAQLNLSESSQ